MGAIHSLCFAHSGATGLLVPSLQRITGLYNGRLRVGRAGSKTRRRAFREDYAGFPAVGFPLQSLTRNATRATLEPQQLTLESR